MLIALHKPYGILSQFTAEVAGQRTLAELELPKGIYPVGRLDRDSEGLLLLTDNNRLKTQLLDPKHKTAKTYCVQVEGVPTEAALAQLRAGVSIRINKRHHHTAPAQVFAQAEPDFPPRDPPIRVRQHIPTSWLSLTITEGKNRQVRRMCAAVGFPVLRLIRTAVGTHQLNGLVPGSWTFLSHPDSPNRGRRP